MLKAQIENTIVDQQKDLKEKRLYTKRHISKRIKNFGSTNHILIITGVRRCGKSTLLKELFVHYSSSEYCNFEDPRLNSFRLNDFQKLMEVFREMGLESGIYFFDEIQNIPQWELFIRAGQDRGYKFYITGSNSRMFSRELGSRLTGRHIQFELFPFSYYEYLSHTGHEKGVVSFQQYLEKGGFPEYLDREYPEILQQLLMDIIHRDLVVRRGIREESQVKDLVVYLLNNISKEFSYNNLSKIFSFGSVNTVISYLDFLEESFLIFKVLKYDYSLKKRQINPRKIYAVDTGLVRVNSYQPDRDLGRLLENIVFLELRRKSQEIYYHKQKKECDLIELQKGKPVQSIQVCWELNDDNLVRELEGLREAISYTKAEKGIILTYNQEDEVEGFPVVPVWKWLDEG
jgi:predicted AAA+ superfamily ATPase